MYSNLSEAVVDKIREEVKKIQEEYCIINPIIRSDIFDILDNLCVVLRYPLENDEEANGIHVQRCVNGEMKDFVFINTSNGIEKQIYTAAHELGHVWKIDEKVLEQINEQVDAEAIINRFAAELLMPRTIFERLFAFKCSECGLQSGMVEDKPLMDVIVFLMNMFMVPYKAVIYRMEEVGIIDTDNREKLEEIERKTPELIRECVNEGKYQNIFKTDSQRSMGDLYNLLNRAEAQEMFSDVKLTRLREQFGYSKGSKNYDEQEGIEIITIPKE